MHELSVAQDVLNTVRNVMREHAGYELKEIRLKLGRFGGVHAESLRFCLDCLLPTTEFAEVQVALEELPSELTCSDCRHVALMDTPLPVCPECGSTRVTMSGFEPLVLEALELEGGDAPT